MKNNQRGLKILAVLLLVLNIWLIHQSSKHRKVILLEKEYFSEAVKLKESIFGYLINNSFIDSINRFQTDFVYPNQLGKECLALVISENDCSSCILNEIYNIENVYNIYEDVLFLCDFSSIETANRFFDMHGYENLNYQLIESYHNLPGVDLNKLPCYCLFSEEGNSTMIFYPDKAINFLTLEYLHFVNNNYF